MFRNELLTGLAYDYPFDSNDIHFWSMREISGSYADGVGTFSMTDAGNNTRGYHELPSGAGVRIYRPGARAGAYYPGGNNFTPAYPLTVCAWFSRDYEPAGYHTVIYKEYKNDNTWAAPFTSFGIQFNNNNPAQFNVSVSIAGVGKVATWNGTLGCGPRHGGFTYDGTTLFGYLNGLQVCSLAVTGAIDYGTDGSFDVGCIRSTAPGAPYDMFPGIIRGIRVCSVARDATWFANVYKAGMGLLSL